MTYPTKPTLKTLFTPLWPGLRLSVMVIMFLRMCLARSFLPSPAVCVTHGYNQNVTGVI